MDAVTDSPKTERPGEAADASPGLFMRARRRCSGERS